jgi:hypothetical protein
VRECQEMQRKSMFCRPKTLARIESNSHSGSITSAQIKNEKNFELTLPIFQEKLEENERFLKEIAIFKQINQRK